MLSCKIGIISFQNNSSTLNLGEIYDISLKRNKDALYKLHTELKFISPFRISIEDNNIIPDNIQDIITIQNNHKLTRKIYIMKGKISTTKKFTSPTLFDLTCMVPVFREENIAKPIFSTFNDVKVFILLPVSNVVDRGEMIDNCIRTMYGSLGFFITLGGKYATNKADMSILSERYLSKCGVDKEYIINLPILEGEIEFEKFKEAMMNVLLIVYSFCVPDSLYICTSRSNICEVLRYVKILRYLKITENKFKFVC